MARFQLAPFEQATLLGPTEAGVCVALCDLLLDLFRTNAQAAPGARMALLTGSIGQARAHQTVYGHLRNARGPTDARAWMGQTLGIDYEEKTTVMVLKIGKAGMLAKVAEDLRPLGSAATWSMRFASGGGHAIAGVNRLERVTSNIANITMHVFDPNIGEYAGAPDVLPEILDDLFNKFPLYADTEEVRRTSARHV